MSAPMRNFEPKEPVKLNPPKDDPISPELLATADGSDPAKVWVAIKGIVFDVSGNASYLPGGSYNVFAGKDASRGLAKSSVKREDALPQWEDLDDKEKGVLEEWFKFFSKRYNIVGKVTSANL
ncbi:cytochrome b5-like heme/steroid binding domain-containing protein [Sphaerosporella brunnea]|uniref:Cytochrome b5-like heme/steroid binding domain-containing protein n=1 Tax=Sphaerosporella brunnea TaxID=1250544 RepID=A0A5J5EDZ7_9PEZI|nr:cytochrome b5-like heme/steroid binding domain-containing protein [Sphaerosporella brunnea]